ncbi:MAG: carbohydrate porin [Candidatus Schekmanbacteria bacterium]|nr:carbohydrate porin [Candidatus Schekmanbacteria bacterium]
MKQKVMGWGMKRFSYYFLRSLAASGFLFLAGNPVLAHSHEENQHTEQIVEVAKVDSPENTVPYKQLSYEELCNRLIAVEKEIEEHKHFWRVGAHEHEAVNFLKGLNITGQMTTIYQSSGLKLKDGDLPAVASPDYQTYDHKAGTATFSADLFVEKQFDDNGYIMFDLEFANGAGVDAFLQGGGMVNNDVMEDRNHHNQPYIARAYYERTVPVSEGYKLILDLGKFGVNDFFDEGERVADQTTQFLNQAICNNGAFDFVQDLQGHGYTYGARAAFETPFVTLSGGVFSADSYLDNINDKYSVVGELAFNIEYAEGIKGGYRIYAFKNRGEYARFDENGTLVTKNAAAINTADNADDLSKGGFGISIDQSLPMGINIFGRYGQQDDDRDVRHYQDMDVNIMFGLDVSGQNWGRNEDVLGVAYEIGKLTGNHRKAHEAGYSGYFDRPGIGAGNYEDERVLEVYYKFSLTEHTAFSVDYQHIENFYYSQKIGAVDFWAARFNVAF